MNSQRTASAGASLAAAVLALVGPAVADPVSYDQVPLSNIVAQLGQQYGVNIVLKGNLATDSSRPTTLHVGDPGTTPTRLQAINALANAAGVDFQKGFVVSKMATDDVTPPVKIDSNGYVVFKDKTVPARDAIAEVATTDNATIQVSDDVTGDVTFSKMTLRTSEAAAEIAQQTHTRWRAYYALTPRSMGLRGKVVDHNNGGQAIVELPFTYYGSKEPPAAASSTGADGAPAGTPQNPGLNAGNPVGYGPVAGGANVAPYSYVSPFGYGQMPFTYGNGYSADSFGNPYQTQYGYFGAPNGGYGGYGNNFGGYGSGYGGYGGVSVLPGNGGYGPFGGYGAPVTF